MRDLVRSAVVVLGAAAVLALGAVADGRAQPVPEGPSGWTDKTAVTARRFMIAAANPHAVDAGYAMLARGGSAVDAAIAAQLVLNLVEPQSSGIGGGAFMLVHDAKRQPAGRLRRPRDGAGGGHARPLPRPRRQAGRVSRRRRRRPLGRRARRGGAARGARTGRTAGCRGRSSSRRRSRWPRTASRCRRASTRCSPRRSCSTARARTPTSTPGRGRPHPVGHVLKNPAFARTLRAIAAGGAKAFYEGEIARDVVDSANLQPGNRGDLTLADLAAYRIVVREPVCGPYRGYRVCGMPPPSSGRHHAAADARDAGAVRRRGDGAGVVLERPLHERGRAARVRRPRRVHRRSGVRRGAGGAARSRRTSRRAAR